MYISFIVPSHIQHIILYSILPLVFSVTGSFLVLYFTNKKIIINTPANAWSSFAYAVIDAPVCLKYPLFVLSIASFNLWSSGRTYIDIIDVTSILWVNVNVTIYVLPDSNHKYKMIYTINGVVTLLLLYTICNRYDSYVFEYYSENIIPDVGIVYIYSGLILSSFHIKDKNYLTGLFSIMCGFTCKMMDIYMGQNWGTCVFHILTALGTELVIRVNRFDVIKRQLGSSGSLESFEKLEPVLNTMHSQNVIL